MIPLPRFWQRHFLVAEGALAIVLTIGFAVWYFWLDGASATDTILQGNRATLYGTTASILGSLLGFVITSTSIVLGFSTSERLAVVRESAEYPKLWKTFSATIWALALSTIVALACLLFDRDNAPSQWLVILMTFAISLSVLRIMRTIWVLENIIGLATRQVKTN